MISIAKTVAFAVAFGLTAASAAQAQDMSTNSAAFNAGYGRVAGQENHPISVGMRDANGNLVIVDGLILHGEDQSTFSASGAVSGAVDTFSGVGASSSANAIGNNLQVITQGNYNTVIVNSVQTNNGNVSASSTH
jgi:holdfast attachment protein HfaA